MATLVSYQLKSFSFLKNYLSKCLKQEKIVGVRKINLLFIIIGYFSYPSDRYLIFF